MICPIRTENLSKSFRRVAALADVNLEVPETGVYGLIGPNGAGKTTTIKLLMNLIRPASGRAEVLGVDSTRLGPGELASIGYVSEDQKLPGWMTVEYFLSYLKPFYPTWDDALAADLARQFNLPLKRKLRQLSRGMRVKAALLSSLAYRPRLLILDEPFTGLDPLVRDELIEGILECGWGATMLISSHDLVDLESFASHIGYLEGGRLVFSEEMTALSGRFREVQVTFEAPQPLPPGWPAAWLHPQTSAAVLRFVETAFDPERSERQIRALFPCARDIDFQPMPLRAIFVALAKAGRQAA